MADIVIVGGGSAGAVLASRLSEDPTRSVLLLEAGRAYGVDGYPDDLLDPAHVPANPEHEWGYTARGGPASPEIDAARAKVLGGCSAHNATVAMRARPGDIRAWQEHGLDDWTVDEVMATYKEMENTPDGDDAIHGRTGPFPVRVCTYEELTPSLRGFIDAAGAEGFPVVADFNGPDPAGVGGYPVNVIDGVRQNTGLVYLTEEVRNRPNLKISGDVLVDRVLFDQGRAVGVVTDGGAEIRAGEVILSCGSYGSPAILLRSGVGPAADLAELGIGVVADLPVGRRLQDQPFYYNAYALKPDALEMRPAVGALLWRQSSEARGDAVGDDQLHDAIAPNLASYGHPTATAPMGGPQDPWAVVHSRGAVKGIDELRVVDASIMPGVPSVALNPTTIMIAERIARTVYAAEPGLGARAVQVA